MNETQLLPKKNWSLTKAALITLAALSLAALAVAIYAHFSTTQQKPRDLGQDLLYVGRQDNASLPFFGNSKTSSNYFFATNMDIAELKSFMTKAGYTLDPNPAATRITSLGVSILTFSGSTYGTEASITYYPSLQLAANTTGTTLNKTSKQHVIAIIDKEYAVLYSALISRHLLPSQVTP